MRGPLRTVLLAALAALAGGLLGGRARGDDAPWEAEVRRAVAEQDKMLGEARRNASMGQVVTTYEGRVGRNPTPLNRYLLARALHRSGDPEGARRQLEAVLDAEPRFWFAHLGLAILWWAKKDAVRAEEHLRGVRAARAFDPDERRLTAEIAVAKKDWAAAVQVLDALVTADPQDDGLRHALAQSYLAKGDWPAAYEQMRLLRSRLPQDVRVRWNYAYACLKTDRLREARQELEVLAKADPQNVQYLDLLRFIALREKDWPLLISVMERLLPFLQEKEKATAAEALKRLKRGEVPDGGTSTEWKQDPIADLIERCTSDDVEVRRKALREFHDLDLAFVPRAVYIHYGPDVEPDPECRSWVLRILGNLASPTTAKLAGTALFDEDATVRRVAAETLGAIGTPAGVVYLQAHFEDHASTLGIEEFNAVRLALGALTGFRDVPIGADPWVPEEGRAAAVLEWKRWFATPEGVAARVRAIEDLEATGEPHPEWYLVVQIVREDESPRVVRASHAVLERHARKPAEDPVARKMLPLFPAATEQDFAPEGLKGLRARVLSWWKAWLVERKAQPAAPATPKQG
jgi:tetratricopeptide (TPR) repeat protein